MSFNLMLPPILGVVGLVSGCFFAPCVVDAIALLSVFIDAVASLSVCSSCCTSFCVTGAMTGG